MGGTTSLWDVRPLGRATQSGNRWQRKFEHVTVSLDCWKRLANFTGWNVSEPVEHVSDTCLSH